MTSANDSIIIRQSSVLNIFLTSKTVYRETVPLYFRCNKFHFYDLDCMDRFLSKVGTECRRHIASITVNYTGKSPKRLAECTGLRRLTLNVDSRSFCDVERRHPHEARLSGMRDLLRIRNLDKIDIFSRCGEIITITWPDPVYASGAQHLKLFTLHTSEPLCAQDLINSLMRQLGVLTKARNPKQLSKLEKKNFPTKPNVMTRSKKQRLETLH